MLTAHNSVCATELVYICMCVYIAGLYEDCWCSQRLFRSFSFSFTLYAIFSHREYIPPSLNHTASLCLSLCVLHCFALFALHCIVGSNSRSSTRCLYRHVRHSGWCHFTKTLMYHLIPRVFWLWDVAIIYDVFNLLCILIKWWMEVWNYKFIKCV